MKKLLSSLIILLIALSLLLTSCASSLSDIPDDTNPATTTEEAKKTETNKTEEKKTEEKKTEEKVDLNDPTKDDVLNLLMIGNSFCTYYPDELAAIADAAGVKMNVYSVYYSGCKLAQHYEWNRGDERNYKLYLCRSGAGKREVVGDNLSLKNCLRQEKWDVISLQQHFSTSVAPSYESCKSTSNSYAALLYKMLRQNYPNAQMVWHQTWAYQVGYARSDGPVETVEFQTKCHENIRKVSHEIAEANNATLVPSGDAWQLARKNSKVGDVLCENPAKNGGKGDYYHDGDTGGGQYLNACVWFEVLTGKSCIGNSWRPDYALSEEKIIELQKCAHQAVAAIHGEDFAK